MIWKHKIGQKGELLASKYLKKKGYKIITKNYRKKWGEIDLIALKGDRWIFVEVKTITKTQEQVSQETNDYYAPEDHLFPEKIKRLERTINSFLSEKGIDEDVDYQIDAVLIVLDKKTFKPILIEHLEDVF